jgi:PucR-like helix-turn-helix protein/diguanylate cyclase with GGDEF domain
MAEPASAAVTRIGRILAARTDELARQVTDTIVASVDFYRDTTVVTDEDLLASVTNNFRMLFSSLSTGESLDTAAPTATGARRADADVPLSAVMAAYRVSVHALWAAVIELAETHPDISPGQVLAATAVLWDVQDAYTDAMTAAYREQAIQRAVADETERAALTEALIEARVFDHITLWEVAEQLGLPLTGEYAVVAAECPEVGRQALPNAAAALADSDIHSAWRLLPDVHVGIVHIASDASHAVLVKVLKRIAVRRVGVSPRFTDLTLTAQNLRYARTAMQARGTSTVTVFEDSVLAVAAVSARDVARKATSLILGGFDDMTEAERNVLFDTFRTWLDSGGSFTQAASVLYVHPNTVRHRLRRIEERTGRLLTVPKQLTELCLAFEVYAAAQA